ncbi:hypothetical protein C8F04DRAFT_1401706 [Mycena alexandri]|uniref:Kelch repeat-containing protein n=1 Tax=Mycena alexandri TaxID=1745969 RepID=A0AAD6SAM6_9AGAR|nr:hypothetical protein C8F04DRAFT_1401706 [Mycena alexandri]
MFGRFSAVPSTRAGSSQIQPAANFAYKKHRLQGDRPFFNDWGSFVVNQQSQKVYIYGGVRPDDDTNDPTSDLYCLDLKTMKWWNMTESLKFRPHNHVFDPFFKGEENLEIRQLPALSEAAVTLTSVGGGQYLIIFGGYNTTTLSAMSDLIAVDLDLLTWWFVDIQGAPIRPRMSAAIVSVDNRLFIFGGRDQFDDETPPIRTYSIAEYFSQTQTPWTWRVTDVPFPPDLPLLGYGIQATPVYGGQKILLTRGRVESDKPIDLSRESTIFFHTQNQTFQDARATMGNFPSGISWYHLGTVVPGAPPSAPASPRRRPGRPSKNTPREPTTAVGAMPTHSFPPSVVVVAWQKHPEHEDDLVPEVWQYFLPPAERIRCLNLGDRLWNLNLDLQAFVVVDSRLLLLGSAGGGSRDLPGAQGSQMAVDKPMAQWDIAVEISSEYLED